MGVRREWRRCKVVNGRPVGEDDACYRHQKPDSDCLQCRPDSHGQSQPQKLARSSHGQDLTQPVKQYVQRHRVTIFFVGTAASSSPILASSTFALSSQPKTDILGGVGKCSSSICRTAAARYFG